MPPVSPHGWRSEGLPVSPRLSTKATSGRQGIFTHGFHVTLHMLCLHKAAVDLQWHYRMLQHSRAGCNASAQQQLMC